MSTSSKSNLKETADDDKPMQITPKKKPIILRIINSKKAKIEISLDFNKRVFYLKNLF